MPSLLKTARLTLGRLEAEAVMHCDVKCGKSIILGGRKGLLVGGLARVGKLVEVKFLGNQMFTTTVVEVGLIPTCVSG